MYTIFTAYLVMDHPQVIKNCRSSQASICVVLQPENMFQCLLFCYACARIIGLEFVYDSFTYLFQSISLTHDYGEAF